MKNNSNITQNIILKCDGINLLFLPANFPNLQKLKCNNNQLTSLPEYSNLKTLYCNDN